MVDWQSGGDARGLRPQSKPNLHGEQTPAVIQDARGVRDKRQNGMGISEGGPMYTLDGVPQHAIGIGASVRRLTPLECERLQGFPDGWTCLCPAEGDTLTCVCPDSPRYRALGNAVAVPVAEWIARQLVRLEAR